MSVVADQVMSVYQAGKLRKQEQEHDGSGGAR